MSGGGVDGASGAGGDTFHVTANSGPGSQRPSSGLDVPSMGSKHTSVAVGSRGGATPGGRATKFSPQPTFAINRTNGASAGDSEDEVKAPVLDDVDAHVWNVDKAAPLHGEDERGQPGQRKEAWDT
jgi:hypothetical protein